MPRVTVIMAAYNTEPFIADAIHSVVTQSERDIELIVVDDQSTDRTGAIARSLAGKDSRIRVLSVEQRSGPGHARNVALAAAKGDWVAVLDSDDWYDPERLEALLSAAEEDGTPLVADNQHYVMDGTERPWRQLRSRPSDSGERISAADLLRGDHLGRWANLGTLKPMVRRDFLEQFGIRYDVEANLCEDFYFLLKCLRHTPHILFLGRPYYCFRTRSRSLTSTLTAAEVACLRSMHLRCCALFKDGGDPVVVDLMKARERQIDTFIRYLQIAEPLRRRDIRAGVSAVMSDIKFLPSFLLEVMGRLLPRLALVMRNVSRFMERSLGYRKEGN